MWGIWAVLIGGGVGLVFLGLALAVGASPVFALLIFAVAAVLLGGYLVTRRAAGESPEAEKRDRRATQAAPRSGGAPASGEGAPPASSESGMPPR